MDARLEEVGAAETALRLAMLNGDVAALDELIDDRLLFFGPDGSVATKAMDLEAHRSGVMKLLSLAVEDERTELHGESTAIVVLRARLQGEFGGQPFSGLYCYARTWLKKDSAWRIVGGAVFAVPEAG